MQLCRFLTIFALATGCFAQDVLHAVSPNGKVEVSFGVALPPQPGAFQRVAYQVSWNGKLVLDYSYMGFWIHNQEPILGQNTGLTESHQTSGQGYNGVAGDFLQNGSLGRRLVVEMRVFNEGVAFRYTIPRTSMLERLDIDTEETEFHFPPNGSVESSNGSRAMPQVRLPLPVRINEPGIGVVTLGEVRGGNDPVTLLELSEERVLTTKFEPPNGQLPVSTQSPWTGAWRVILVGASAQDPQIAAKYLK